VATAIGSALCLLPLAAQAAATGEPIGGPELGSTTTVWHVPTGVPAPPPIPAKG
jgi:hypothetical protein